MKKIFLATILFSFFSLAFFNCSEDSSKDDDGTTDSTQNTNTSTGAAGKVVTASGLTTISGGKTYEFDMALENANYILTIKEKSIGAIKDFSLYEPVFKTWMGLKASSCSPLNATSGYYEYSSIHNSTSTGSYKYKVDAKADYIVEFKKLPLTGVTADALPKTYSGKGRKVYGPFAVTGTSATITLKCADAKQAGFSAEFFDGNGKDAIDENYSNFLYTNYDLSTKVFTYVNIDKSVTRTKLTAGNFFVEVAANDGASYTVEVK